MGNGIFSFNELCYFLLIIVNFLLNVIYCVLNCFLYILKVILQQIVDDVNMTDKSKKRKRNTPSQPNQTFIKRVIDENWQKLLSSNLMEAKTEKVEDKKDHFTGVFRRARKKNNDASNNEKNFKSLNINNKSLNNNTETQNGVSKCDSQLKKQQSSSKNVNESNKTNKLTKFIAMDCEMVGVGFEGGDHMLARVSLVNKFGDCIYDKFVKPREEVIDYRTNISGIRKEDLLKGEDFTTVQKEVAEILWGRILIGHSLKNDLSVLFLSHPKRNIRDTSRYKPFRKITKGSTPSLKRLAKEILGIDIQHGEHSSVEDAKAVMQLYCTVSKNWEQGLSEKKGYSKKFIES